MLNFLASEKAAIRSLFRRFGFGECTDEMISRYSAINVSYWQALERNEYEKSEMLVLRFRDFFALEGLDTSRAESFNEAYQLALGDTIVFCPGAEEVLEKLKGSFIFAAITNGTRAAQTKKLAASGLDKIFDYVFISEELGAEKPNRDF